MMYATFVSRYSALSGLDGLSFAINTGLHPVLTDSALSGLMENSIGSVGSYSLGFESIIIGNGFNVLD